MGLLYPLPCSLLLFVLEMPVWLSGLSPSHRETCPGSWPPHALPTPRPRPSPCPGLLPHFASALPSFWLAFLPRPQLGPGSLTASISLQESMRTRG